MPRHERDEVKITMVIMGVLVPLIALWLGLDAWITEEAKWPQRRGSWITVEGVVAKSLGVAYIGIAVACLSHWVFRYVGRYAMRHIGLITGFLLFVAGLVNGLVHMF